MKIFISYRRADSKDVVDRIRDRLITAYDADAVFRDIESIPLGHNFSDILDEAASTCNVMLVVIGPEWAGITDAEGNKRLFDPGDFTRIEVETGLAHRDILVIPVLVKNALMPAPQDVPDSLRDLLFCNASTVQSDPYFNQDMQRLIQGVNSSVGTAPINIQYFEPETINIPAGPFLMGSNARAGISSHETPQHEINLPDYRFGKYPVTNAQYEEFVRDTHRSVAPEMGWDGLKVPPGLEKLPVVSVTFYDALAYCQWLSEKTHRSYSIPNEAQWEKAARGNDQRIYPWGDKIDLNRCNHDQAEVASVNAYPAQSEYGCFDLVGNVRQWTCTLWGEKRIAPDPDFSYPWEEDGRNNLDASRQIRRVVRGSSMKDRIEFLRCSARRGTAPSEVGLPGALQGFRIVLNIEKE